MSRTLGWIAAIGLGVGVVSLSLAYALGGRDAVRHFGRSHVTSQARANSPAADATEWRVAWNGGDTIDIALPGTVRLSAGNDGEIVVRGTPDALASLQLQGSRLFVDDRWSATRRTLEVEVPARALRHVRISGSAEVALDKLDQSEFTLTISGSGNARVQGAVDRLVATISGSGNARLGDLAAKRLTAKISGSGNIEATPKDEADIHIAGSGNVRLLTRPARLQTHVAGSGRISQPQEPAESRK